MKLWVRVPVLMAVDACLVQGAMWTALYLRLDGRGMDAYWAAYGPNALPLIAGTILLAALAGLYVSLWRYASVLELVRIGVVGVSSAGLLGIATLVLPAQAILPRSVPFIYALLIVVLMGGSRMSLRIVRRWLHGRPIDLLQQRDERRGKDRPRELIVGAGDAGAAVLEELSKNDRHVVGFVDDDPAKTGMKIRGVRVLGTTDRVPELVRSLRVDEIVLAMPSAPAHRLRSLVEAWQGLPVRLNTIPRIQDLIDGRVTVKQIRPVDLEDLLNRPAVELDTAAISRLISGRRVLVTGAGGSIGAEMCRQIARFHPAELVMVGHGENSLFEAGQSLQECGIEALFHIVIADVRDRAKIQQVFHQYRPELVFHAAAHKHVPFMEEHPEEACKTNIFGTQNVAHAAIECGTDRFVLISTDKAVNPTSVMGATKRVAEMIVRDLNGLGGTRFMAVRFGNVLGSRGSVVPTFRRQIALGGPVTVTHPDMERYFMTIPEASQLVLQAAVMGEGGEVFVLDMGEPVRIVDLARHLIILSGYEPDRDIEICFTGKRPGEKLYEELLTAEEGTDVTHHERVYVARARPVDSEMLAQQLAKLEAATFGRETFGQETSPSPALPAEAWQEFAAAGEDKPDPRTIRGTSRVEASAKRARKRAVGDGARDDGSHIVAILKELVPSYNSERFAPVNEGPEAPSAGPPEDDLRGSIMEAG